MITSALPHVDLPAFDGPLALLVELIERNKVEVTSISVEAVTSEYLHRVSSLENLDTSHLIEFVQLGSRLIYIKSLALLPGKTDQAEELALLEQDLTEYRRYRKAAETLGSRLKNTRSWTKGAQYKNPEGRHPSTVSIEQLSAAFNLAIARNRPLPATSILKRHLDIKVVISSLLKAIDQGPLSLQTLIDTCTDRLEIIVTFLALLEIIKSHEIIISQENQFAPIFISTGVIV